MRPHLHLFTLLCALSSSQAAWSKSLLGSPDPACSFSNPLRQAESADPHVTYKDGWYYYLFTTGDGVWVRRAAQLQDLGQAPASKVWSLGGEIKSRVWAPELHYIKNKWRVYASGSLTPDTDEMRMFTLEADSADPLGSYSYRGLLADIKAIDQSPWQDPATGKWYLAWSQYSPDGQCIYIGPLSSPRKLGHPRVKLSQPQHPWERHGWAVNEGPAFLQRHGKLFIAYSASGCSTPDYALGLLTNSSGDWLNPRAWSKSASPVFQRHEVNKVWGPGHNCFVRTPSGEDWILYHAKDSPENTNRNRSTRAQRFTWKEDGTPDFGVPLAEGEKLRCPD